MSRPSTEHYDLSETEKRELIKLIEAGKPLPERYRFMLFEDKREVELVWNGKSRDVCTAILPFDVGAVTRAEARAYGRLPLSRHSYPRGSGTTTAVAVKVIGIFGNDTMALIAVSVG